MIDEKKTVGRPAHTPTDEHYEIVRGMLLDGVTQKAIAKVLGIHEVTFFKAYGDFIESVKVEERQKIAKQVSDMAKGGDAKAAMALLKEQQRESFAFHDLDLEDETDPIKFLEKVWTTNDIPLELRIKSAVAALPYRHARVAPQGKKEARKSAAENLANGKGKFGTLGQHLKN